MSIAEALKGWLEAGGSRIGQLLVSREKDKIRVLHHEDAGRSDLDVSSTPEKAREIAKYDDEGNYRPLKSAPNLRHGWELRVAGLGELRLTLDFFYPAALGTWVWQREERLNPVPFRETAERQSGMYEIVKRITDEEADGLAGDFCASAGKCLKTILWDLRPGREITSLPREKFEVAAGKGAAMPLLCPEACNLFVAAARGVVRRRKK